MHHFANEILLDMSLNCGLFCIEFTANSFSVKRLFTHSIEMISVGKRTVEVKH